MKAGLKAGTSCFVFLLVAGAAWAASSAGSLPDGVWADNARVRSVLEPTQDFSRAESFELMQAGAGTSTQSINRNAYSHHTQTLGFDSQDTFKLGNGMFNKSWVASPSSTHASDGLGPFYSARACQGCHIKDGRGHLSSGDEIPQALVFQLRREHEGRWTGDPVYGGQLQGKAVTGVKAEGRIRTRYDVRSVALAGGESRALRAPRYELGDLSHGPLHENTRLSPRLAPAIIGLGLLEAIDEDALLAYADPDDQDGDGISGRPNWQLMADGERRMGRFGLKAAMATVEQQNAHALFFDMGLSTPLLTDATGDCTPAQNICQQLATGVQPRLGDVEVPDPILEWITFYTSHLAVPERRDVDDPVVLKGKSLFYNSGCTGCHTPKHVTSKQARIEEHRFQLVWPYTDLLLHDMGDDLADHTGEQDAGPREWRTPPLWGIGLAKTVNPAATFLHDGRAETILDAVLWHGGEAEASAQQVRDMSRDERQTLLTFLESL